LSCGRGINLAAKLQFYSWFSPYKALKSAKNVLYIFEIDKGENAGRFLMKLPRGSLIFQRLK
jgi:hypothetical protein